MAATLYPNGKQYYALASGLPNAGGKVYTYAAGTSTPKDTYTDATAATPNANPVVLDARGEATIFWSGNYKITLRDAAGNLIWTVDNVAASASPDFTTPTIPISVTGLTVKGDSTTLVKVQQADGTNALNINTTAPFVSAVGTRTSTAPRITGGSATDTNYDSFITSNCTAAGSVLYRDEFQDRSRFSSTGGDGAHASFDAFSEFTGSTTLNHSRGFQSRGKISMTGTALLSEYTGFFMLPIFNGTFNVGEMYGLRIQAAQIDSGTQNVFASYAIKIDTLTGWGNAGAPYAIWVNSDKSYFGGNIQCNPLATDIYDARQVKAKSVHGTGALTDYATGGGVAMYQSGTDAIIQAYADGAGTVRRLKLSFGGGGVQVGTSTNGGALLDVGGLAAATGYYVGANQVVGARGTAVTAPTGGATIDSQARTAINDLISRLQAHGLIS